MNENTNETKDDLLAAFENPDMSNPEVAQEMAEVPVEPSPVVNEPVVPAVDLEPVVNEPINQVVESTPEVAPSYTDSAVQTPVDSASQNVEMVSTDSIIAPEFQNAPEPTPVPVTPQPVEPTPEPVAPDTQTVESTSQMPETLTESSEMQNTMPNVSEEPSVSVKQEIKNEDIQDDPNFLKKNIKFILIICAVIAVFIILLPKLLSLFSGGKY